MSSIAQGFGDVRGRLKTASIGMLLAFGALVEYHTAWNKDPQAAEVNTVTVTTTSGTGGQVHTVSLSNGESASYTTTGSEASTAAIASALADAINQEPLVRGRAVATVNGAVITLTAITPGDALGVAFAASGVAGAAASVATTTAADEADPIPFGRAIVRTGRDAEAGDLCALASVGAFTAQTDVWDITYDAGAVITAHVYRVDAESKTLLAAVQHTMATDLNTSVDALVGKLNASLPANTVVVTNESDDLQFVAELAGLEFEVLLSADTATPAPALTSGGASQSTSFVRAFMGVTMESLNDPATLIGGTEASYAGNAGVRYLKRGPLAVASDDATVGAPVYVELAAGATAGRFYTTASSTRLPLGRTAARWVRDAADGKAGLHLDL